MKKVLVLVIMIYPFIASFGLQPKWRLNLGGGMGYLLPSYSVEKKGLRDMGFDSEKVDNYYNKFKLGVQGNMDVHYLFNKNWGGGVKYSFFASSASLSEQAYWSYMIRGTEEIMYINYVGPSIHVRAFVDQGKSLLITSSVSLGYANYMDDAKVKGVRTMTLPRYGGYGYGYPSDKISMKMSSDSWGFDWGVGLEWVLSPEFSIGLDLGVFYSSFHNFKLNVFGETFEINDEAEVNVTRVNASLGLRMYLF